MAWRPRGLAPHWLHPLPFSAPVTQLQLHGLPCSSPYTPHMQPPWACASAVLSAWSPLPPIATNLALVPGLHVTFPVCCPALPRPLSCCISLHRVPTPNIVLLLFIIVYLFIICFTPLEQEASRGCRFLSLCSWLGPTSWHLQESQQMVAPWVNAVISSLH